MTPLEIAAKVCSPGFMARPTFDAEGNPSDWRPVDTVAVMWQEARGDPRAVGKRIQVPVNGVPTWAVALGWCQLLTAWHVDRGPYADVPRMTVAECFDIDACWARAWLVMNRKRTGWRYDLSAWSAFTSGAYRQHLPIALSALRSLP